MFKLRFSASIHSEKLVKLNTSYNHTQHISLVSSRNQLEDQ